ncbi:MAG: HAD family phosphatase [Treponema sp.]|nr:HAD family phosphatase [Treponema sp.]
MSGDGIKAFVFDMDGLLLDTEAVYDSAWIKAAKMWNLDGIEPVHRSVYGFSESDTLLVLKENYGNDFDAKGFWNLTTDISLDMMNESGVPEKAFARETISFLKKKSYPLALASSSSRDLVSQLLEKAGMLDLFEVIVCGDEIERAKPDPQIYISACKKLGLSPSECAAVEDSPNGILSAYNAGLKCIMIPDRLPATEEIKKYLWKLYSNLGELKEWFCA